MATFGDDDIDKVMSEGIVFRGAPKQPSAERDKKVNTKAKKKAYITAVHHTGAAKMRKEIRQQRKDRNSRHRI